MPVRAKFRVGSIRRSYISRYEDGKHVQCEIQTIEMYPVTGSLSDSDENRKFYAATPSGKIELGCVNAEAAQIFDLAREYYVDFTPVD